MQEKKKRKEKKIDFTVQSEKAFNLWKKKDDIRKAKSSFAQALKYAALTDATSFWIKELRDNMIYNPDTIENYRRYLDDLFSRGLLPKKNSLGNPYCVDELHYNRKLVLNLLVEEKSLSDNEKRYRLNALISFSKFLEIETLGFFKKFKSPSNLKLSSTDRLLSPKMLTTAEYNSLRKELWKISQRDCLVIDLVYFTGRSLADILNITLNHVNYEDKTIFLRKGLFSFAYVKINNNVFDEIDRYIKESKKYRMDSKKIFITNRGNSIFRTRFPQLLSQASEKADLGFTATSMMIQRSYIEKCIQAGLTEEQIKKKLKLLTLNAETTRRKRYKK
jgi:site-specific recombinase XerD